MHILKRPFSAATTLIWGVLLLWSNTGLAAKLVERDSAYVTFGSGMSVNVMSDGLRYTQISATAHPSGTWTLPARFRYDAPDNDRIKGYRLQLRMEWKTSSHAASYAGETVAGSYSALRRPKKVDVAIAFHVEAKDIESFVVNACNALADELRSNGQSNSHIFGEPHEVKATLYASSAIDILRVPPGSFESSGYHPHDKFATIICRESPEPNVGTVGGLKDEANVSEAQLTVLEQSTLGGSCKVNLSTVIKTNEPDTEVKFRFEHTNGKLSDIKTVKTSHSSTAMDAYWYDVPTNGSGEAAGSVRIVGVSHQFNSAWKTYSMQCHPGSPGDVATTAPPPPTVELALEPVAKVMHRGMICPTRLKVRARLLSTVPFSGTGLVSIRQGGYAFGQHTVHLAPNLAWQFFEEMDLKPWDAVPSPVGMAGGSQNLQANAGSGHVPPTQRIELRYTLSNNQEPVVVTPFKTIAIACVDPKVNAGIQPATGLGFDRPVPPQQTVSPPLQAGGAGLQSPDGEGRKPAVVSPVQKVVRPLDRSPRPGKPRQTDPSRQMSAGKPAGQAAQGCQYDPNSARLPCAGETRKPIKLINPFE